MTLTFKMCKEYLNNDIQYTCLILYKKLNRWIYRMLYYINIYGSYKLSKNCPVFWPTCIYIQVYTSQTRHHRIIHKGHPHRGEGLSRMWTKAVDSTLCLKKSSHL